MYQIYVFQSSLDNICKNLLAQIDKKYHVATYFYFDISHFLFSDRFLVIQKMALSLPQR
jgi:hypothetical protein